MAALFDGVDDYLTNNSPALLAAGAPLTVGCWFNVNSFAAAPTLWIYSDTATLNARLNFAVNASGNIGLAAKDSAAQALSLTTAAVTVGTWVFVVARFISTTNRRLSVLFPNGTIEHIQNTTSKTPLTMTAVTVGAFRNTSASAFLDGRIGEMWWADADIQADAAQLSNATLRQLAYAGPWSLPHMRKNIVEYHSMRSSLPSTRLEPEEHYARAPQTWSNVGGVGIGAHPPIPGWHEKQMTRTTTAIAI